MSELRVSVIVPAYRCARVIRRAIDSLLAQTRRPDEIIVIDDGSPDDLAGALAPYGESIRLLHKSNGGASSARNVGLDMAQGDVIAFLDSDDYWHPTKLEKQLAILQQYPEVGLVTSRYTVKMADGLSIDYPFMGAASYDQVLVPHGSQIFDLAMLISTVAVVIRRQVLASARFDVTLKIAEDRDLWVRLLSRSSIYLQSETTATVVESPGSLSRSDLDLDCRCMLELVQRSTALLGSSGVRKWKASIYRRWAGTHLSLGRPNRALRPAARRLMYQPLSAEGWWVLLKSSAFTLGRVRTVAPNAEPQMVS
jgi:glycosyltransferase involved in cell wall biosynthesis